MIYIFLLLMIINLNANILKLIIMLLFLELFKLVLKHLYDTIFFLNDLLMVSICDIFIDKALFLHISVPLPLIFQLDLQSFRGQNRFVDDA